MTGLLERITRHKCVLEEPHGSGKGSQTSFFRYMWSYSPQCSLSVVRLDFESVLRTFYETIQGSSMFSVLFMPSLLWWPCLSLTVWLFYHIVSLNLSGYISNCKPLPFLRVLPLFVRRGGWASRSTVSCSVSGQSKWGAWLRWWQRKSSHHGMLLLYLINKSAHCAALLGSVLQVGIPFPNIKDTLVHSVCPHPNASQTM